LSSAATAPLLGVTIWKIMEKAIISQASIGAFVLRA
jgi:hypothetical protein